LIKKQHYGLAAPNQLPEPIAKDYEDAETTQKIIKIASPIAVIMLLVTLAWFIVRRVLWHTANQEY
jgi:hypothetical protein